MHLARAVQGQIWRIDAAQPVTNIMPMQEWVRQSISLERFSAGLFLGFALIGLVSAAIGLFGVLAYAVSRGRTSLAFEWRWVRRSVRSSAWC